MEQKKYLIMAASTAYMLAGERLLRENGMNTDLVPAPPEYGTVCAIAIKVAGEDIEKANNILASGNIKVDSVYEERVHALDNLLSRLTGRRVGDEFLQAIKKVERGEELLLDDVTALLSVKTQEEKQLLFASADQMRHLMVGDRVDIRGAIEFSNYCEKNCLYCGIRRDHPRLKRYRMDNSEIMAVVRELHAIGLKTVILQSGEDRWWSRDKLVELIHEIKDNTGMRITLSIGERPFDEYKAFKNAGADNFLLKIETTNRELYKALHPDGDFDNRMSCSKWLKQLGYLNGSGSIIGIPGQTLADIAADILYFKQMGINMIGIGPFMPAQGTPLESHPAGDVELTLKAVAVTRLVCKNVYIPATTALVSAHPDGQVMALLAGANSIMLVNTPDVYRKEYQIYSNKCPVDLDSAIEAINKAGRQWKLEAAAGV